jgi:hypothetical protein
MPKRKPGTKTASVTWSSKLESLGAKARRGRNALRAKRKELTKKLQPTYSRTKKKLAKLSKSAGEEAVAVGAGLGAGWNELRRAYSAKRAAQTRTKAKRAR